MRQYWLKSKRFNALDFHARGYFTYYFALHYLLSFDASLDLLMI